ncbi:hypothetical protein FHT80_004520 [Rhizobium sp. BK226]|nr:hypothetical protein [Rhizobium anhuiense]MBB3746158.1 hypothetical protein [Rhizobium sp. BK591]MBB4115157.1 hypothetical protein [Rhizobium sp. BK226]
MAAAAGAKNLILCLNPICLRRRIGHALDNQALAPFCDLFWSCPALFGVERALGIFEIIPEDRHRSREYRGRNQPKLDADRFDDMKLHITETEEASPNQGEAEDYRYRFPCPRSLRHTSPQFPTCAGDRTAD